VLYDPFREVTPIIPHPLASTFPLFIGEVWLPLGVGIFLREVFARFISIKEPATLGKNGNDGVCMHISEAEGRREGVGGG
jgi:hypothetical protein